MAPSREIEVADTIVAELNAPDRAWSGAFLARRAWDTAIDHAELSGLQVLVVPLSLETGDLSRGRGSDTYRVAIDLQERVSRDDDQRMDELSLLAEQIHDHYRDRHALAIVAGGGHVVEARRDAIYDPDVLYMDGVWETLIELTIRVEVSR